MGRVARKIVLANTAEDTRALRILEVTAGVKLMPCNAEDKRTCRAMKGNKVAIPELAEFSEA
jgi:hypothetical protein